MASVQGSLEICEVHEMVHEEKVPKEHAQAITEHLRNSRLHADEFANASASAGACRMPPSLSEGLVNGAALGAE